MKELVKFVENEDSYSVYSKKGMHLSLVRMDDLLLLEMPKSCFVGERIKKIYIDNSKKHPELYIKLDFKNGEKSILVGKITKNNKEASYWVERVNKLIDTQTREEFGLI